MITWTSYKIEKGQVVSIRRNTIIIISWLDVKPGASINDFFDANGPFLSSKSRSWEHIISPFAKISLSTCINAHPPRIYGKA